MASYDVIIKNGMIFDGRRNPRFKGDIGIRDGLIAEIGLLESADAERVLEADGLHVAPGFIDLHTHYDSQLFWDPYCSSSGWHGVTTVAIGNCGFGFAPCRVGERERAMLTMTRTEAVPLAAMKAGMPWDWVTFPEFIESVRKAKKSVNVAINVPLNPLLIWVMGIDRAKSGALPTHEEHRQLERLLDEAMEAGAIGISAQRLGQGSNQRDFDGTPMPTDLMHDETMLVFADVLRRRGEGVIQYTYTDHADMFVEPERRQAVNAAARLHVEEVARRSGRPVIVFPVPVAGGLDWAKSCRERGLRVCSQRFTVAIRNDPMLLNVAEGAGRLDNYPAWCQATVGSIEDVKRKLRDPQVRARIAADLSRLDPEKWVLLRGKTTETARYDEMLLGDIAVSMGKSDCMETFFEITLADDLQSEWSLQSKAFKIDLEPFQKIIDDPYWIPGISDGGAHTKFLTTGHCGTLFVISYAREHQWLSLEDAHFRLSALPASYAGLQDSRGTLVVGAPADIIVYDYDRLAITPQDKAHDYPGNEWRIVDRGVGYRWVLVNGHITIENDQETGVHSGCVVHSEKHGRRRRSLFAAA